MRAGFHWYHLLATTYGAWLYGDARGFRTRHHREHVEGDYRNRPSPGAYESLAQRSKLSLKQAVVTIRRELRPVVGKAIIEKLRKLGALLVTVSVGGQHLHVLAKLPRGAAA